MPRALAMDHDAPRGLAPAIAHGVTPIGALRVDRPRGSCSSNALNELHQCVLKFLTARGHHGMLQKHLFQRLAPKRLNTMMLTVAELEQWGYVTKSTTTDRYTTGRVILWTITDAGLLAFGYGRSAGEPLAAVAR